MLKNSILLVDDDPVTYELIKASLKDAEIVYCKDLKEAEQQISAKIYSSIILDLHLPDGDGLRFLSKLKDMETLRNVPITILSSETGISHKVMAFEYGADDYVVKPFDPLEFRSRIFSRIKKTKEKSEDQSKILIGDFSLDLQTFKAFMKQGSQTIDLNLTPLEIKILFYLAHSMDQVFSRAQIMDYLWKDTYVNDRTVDSHIAHLRQKILDTPISIDTVKGIGYKISRK